MSDLGQLKVMEADLSRSSGQGVKPHSCKHCQRRVLQKEHDSQRDNNNHTGSRWLVRYSYGEAISNALNGCLFFQWCFPGPDAAKYLRNKKDKRKSIMIIIRDNHIAEIKKNGQLWSELVISTDEGDPVAYSIKSRPVNVSPGSESTFELIRGWLSKCKCDVRSGPLPTRVLDVGTEDSCYGNPKLCITSKTDSGVYVCLSYCWGKEQSIKLTLTTLSAWVSDKGIPFREMPQTIQDAITATRKIGLRFLWIDRLCIIQDDLNDKAQQIALMPKIFRNNSFTISASRAKGCEEGFLHERLFVNDVRVAFRLPMKPLPRDRISSILKPEGNEPNGSIIMSSDCPPGYIIGEFDEPIHSRAWTFQEHILSRRMLDYGTRQLLWRCSCSTVTDGGKCDWKPQVRRQFPDRQSRIVLVTPPESRFYEQFDGLWCEFVEDYTARSMTFPIDRAYAISGLAEEYQKIMRSSYIAGVWQSMFPAALLWRLEDMNTLYPRPREYRAPSWSWISVDGPVKFSPPSTIYWSKEINGFDAYRRENKTECVEVIRWEIELETDHAPYGAIRGGYIALKGRLLKAQWTDNRTRLKRERTSTASYLQENDDYTVISNTTIPDTNDCVTSSSSIIDVWLLPVIQKREGFGVSILGLIMGQLSNERFQRLGLFEYSPKVGVPPEVLLTSPKREFLIF